MKQYEISIIIVMKMKAVSLSLNIIHCLKLCNQGHYNNNPEGYFYKCSLQTQLRLLCKRRGIESMSTDYFLFCGIAREKFSD